MEICSREKCTGCMACTFVCPQKCIVTSEDEIGHYIPEIDKEKCIDCGACKRICPSLNAVERNRPDKAFAAVSKDYNEYITSSSGGAAAVMSRYTVENGGVVYGCTGTKGYDICYIRVDNPDGLWRLKGSKYVESRTGDCFNEIKKDLSDEKAVLFIGTPCRAAAAKKLFGNNEKFFTIDLICHGVPPMRLLREHISSKISDEPDEIKFRDGQDFTICAARKGITLYKSQDLRDLYYTGFFKMLYFRKSCYSCQYANAERVGDLTIGDFWGVGELNKITSAKDGLSVILANTEKGKELLENCEDAFEIEERSVEEAISGNAQLRRPAIKHKNADKFRELYPKLGFKKAANRCLVINRIKYFILSLYNKAKK